MSGSRWIALEWLSMSVLMTSYTLSADAAREVRTVIIEEEPSGSHVLDLSTTHLITDLLQDQPTDDVRYQILGSSEYLLMDEFSGVITTRIRLDRETVCTPVVDVCVISIDVMISYEQQFSIIKVKVELADLDDNIPVFTQPSITLNISEGDNLNITLSIPQAVDSDTEHNVDTVYHLIKPDNLPLTVDISLLWSITDLYMIISGDLDYEMIRSHSFTVQSFTPAQSYRRSNLIVNLNILDTNDNMPVFSQSVYRIKVSESMAINAVIGQVSASDNDASNINSRVYYKLVHGEDNSQFAINALNGELTLGDNLDYEKTADYILTVLAYNDDEGAPADHMAIHMTSTAVVYVSVTDENDHSPQITITTLEDDHIATIAEHSVVGTFIAHITVRDGDSTSPNHDVICHLNSDKYSLNSLYDTEYTITVNSDLDRESTRSTGHDVIVGCSDGGNPPLLSQVTIPVVLVDVNDHTPEFSKSVHHVYHLTENSPLYTSVIRLTATDRDEADNSKIKYTIKDADMLPFTIDESTGFITVSDILDHEMKSEYVFSVTAQDRGNPPLSATSSVHVHLVDLNDNRPIFDQSEYSFEIREELSAPTVDTLGEVIAVDADQNGGAKVWYKLLGDEEGDNHFGIDYSTGVIYTSAQLDRERKDHYQLTVVATDFGVPELTSSVRVNIRVTDINDNSPAFRAGETNQTCIISYQSKAGVTVTVITATDADTSDRSLLTYSLMANREETADIFTIHPTTGRLYTARSLTEQSIGSHSITVIVTDTAQHAASLDISVIISDETTQAPPVTEGIRQSREYHINITIISVLSGVVFIVAVLAVTVYIKLRNQKSKGSGLYNCRRAAESRFSNSITSSQTSDYQQHNNDIFSNLTDSSHLHNSIISDRSQVHSMCDGSGCDNRIIPAYIKEGSHLARAFSMRTADSGCESLASPHSISLLKLGNRTSTFITSPEYQPAPAVKRLVSYDMQKLSAVQTPASYVNTRSDSTCAVKDMTVSIPYADDSIAFSKDIHDDSTSSCDVFTTDDIYSYNGDNELHSGNCVVCLDNSVVSWNHRHYDIDAHLSYAGF